MTQFLPASDLHSLTDAQLNFDAIDGNVLLADQNLADVSASQARTNLGLGTAATDSQNHWPQLPSDQATQFLWGHVLSTGGVGAGSSGDFTVTLPGGTGVYQLNWTTNFANTGYAVTVSVFGGYYELVLASELAGSIQVQTLSTGDVATALGFTFMAVGQV